MSMIFNRVLDGFLFSDSFLDYSCNPPKTRKLNSVHLITYYESSRISHKILTDFIINKVNALLPKIDKGKDSLEKYLKSLPSRDINLSKGLIHLFSNPYNRFISNPFIINKIVLENFDADEKTNKFPKVNTFSYSIITKDNYEYMLNNNSLDLETLSMYLNGYHRSNNNNFEYGLVSAYHFLFGINNLPCKRLVMNNALIVNGLCSKLVENNFKISYVEKSLKECVKDVFNKKLLIPNLTEERLNKIALDIFYKAGSDKSESNLTFIPLLYNYFFNNRFFSTNFSDDSSEKVFNLPVIKA